MTSLFAHVAVPFPLYSLFTYSVPEHLRLKVTRGSIVAVQFGKKLITGTVVNLAGHPPSFPTKPIIDIFDQFLTIPEKEITLAEWMSDYYVAPIGETLKLFAPAGLNQIGKRIVSLSPLRMVEPHSLANNASKKKIIEALQSSRHLTISQLQKRTGIKNIYSLTRELENAGALTIEEKTPRNYKKKLDWYLDVTGEMPGPMLRGKSQIEAWSKIKSVKEKTGIPVSLIFEDTKISMAALRALEAKQIIALYKKEKMDERVPASDQWKISQLPFELNPEQHEAVTQISNALTSQSQKIFLLYGVTGSGKTQVYIEGIRAALRKGKSAIVLVPEISLTPQTVERFQKHFGDLVVWMHSRLSNSERYDAWCASKKGTGKIIIGPRSALFAPLKNIGLIVVDEEHESSYKQFDSSPRYNARDVAIMRASYCGAVTVLGSATPSIESYENALAGRYTLLSLPTRVDHAVLPPVRVVNMIEERKKRYVEMKAQAKIIGKKAFEGAAQSISELLKEKIADRIERREGVILLQNRRGFAPFLECNDCGAVERCEQCSVTLTYHATHKHLRCHYCGKVYKPPTVCSQCGGHEFMLRGFGTQRVEEELHLLFPDATILRMDLDTTSKRHSHETLLRQFGEGKADILLGTQMVAKGLDFPRVTLVGVISADTQMMLPDFRSAERTFQLLSQVAGRAGRSSLQGEVIIQTSQPDHYALTHVIDHNFISFYNNEIGFRHTLGYPPFSRISLIEIRGKKEADVESVAFKLAKKIIPQLKGASMLGPAPAVLSKIKNEYRWHLVIKADKEKDKNAFHSRKIVSSAVQEFQKSNSSKDIKIIIDVDPAGII